MTEYLTYTLADQPVCGDLLGSPLLTLPQVNSGTIPRRISVLTRADLENIHKYSDRHRQLLERSERAGCFYCKQFFSPGEIMDWIDGRQVETGSTQDGVTALCPRCGIDAVLPSAAPIPLTAEVLAQMRYHWFDK